MRPTQLALVFSIICLFTAHCGTCSADHRTFAISPSDKLVGQITRHTTRPGENLLTLARRYDLGYDQIIKANPSIDPWIVPEGTEVFIPTLYLLPPGEQRGIVINLAELRLYYFLPTQRGSDSRSVATYPISAGRVEWKTPRIDTTVSEKVRNPTWYPTDSIRREHLKDGDRLPPFIPGGSPANPLGAYALRLGANHYMIHGTSADKEEGIGMRVTHGCIRMYPEDIEDLFARVSAGTPVRIINEPILFGSRGPNGYIVVHRPVFEPERKLFPDLSVRALLTRAERALSSRAAPIDQRALVAAYEWGSGIPIQITAHEASHGFRGSSEPVSHEKHSQN